ncbi:MAG TPA: ZIP family metal transporter [Chloroflexota bacterium]|nr:ZIP family metal transporter [Chloroflexota bacterium]
MTGLAAIAAASVSFFSTLAGGVVALRWSGRVNSLAAFASGLILGAAFFDLLPDAVERADALGLGPGMPLGAALVGFLAFHSLERFLHHHHAEDEGPSAAGIVGAAGFVVHSLFDGLAIGLGFQISMDLGVLVAVAVIGHDFSDGLNTMSYLVTHRQPMGRARGVLLADAIAPTVGAAIATAIPFPDVVFPLGIGCFSGLFVYAGATRLLPRAEALPPMRSVMLTTVGAGFLLLVSRLA